MVGLAAIFRMTRRIAISAGYNPTSTQPKVSKQALIQNSHNYRDCKYQA